ncbi:MAG: MFS transporter [Actinomycetota bacterium]
MPLSRGPLSSRNFRLLMTCNVISVGGSAVAFVAVPFAVLSVGGSASDVGFVATAELIPLTAFLLLGGVIADRLPRHLVMVAAVTLQAAAQGTAAALLLTGHARVWQLIALAGVGGVGIGFFYPAEQGLLPQTVPAGQQAPAIALDRTVRNAASIGGAALGGLLTGFAGPGWGLAIDAASFAVGGVLLAALHFPALPPAEVSSMLHDLREGWQEFVSRRWLWTIVLQFGLVTAAAAGAIDVLGPLVAHAHLGGARSWGVIVAAYSAGAVIGGLVMIRFRPRRMLVAAVLSVPAFSVILFALAVPLPVPLDVAAAFFSGCCLEVLSVCWFTTLQQEIPPDKLSRISSYDAFGAYALTPVGTAVAGPLADAFGTRAVLAVSGVVIAVFPLFLLFEPEIRRLRRKPPPSAPGPAAH